MCKWEPQYVRDYRCDDSPLDGDPKGYCILHSKDENKDIGAFREKVCGRIATTGNRIDLIGCYFPSGFKADFFQKGRVEKPVDFSEATFTKGANFIRATFTEGANFVRAAFTQGADFSWATFAKGANFTKATFPEGANFREAAFTQGAYFSEATFTEGADFVGATFTKWAYFMGATFTEGADFLGAKFTERADFSKAKFTKEADFRGAEFAEGTDFSEAKFSQKADFFATTFNGDTNFNEAEFSNVTFVDVVFKKMAGFVRTRFKGRVEFIALEGGRFWDGRKEFFGDMGQFVKTYFEGDAIFQNMKLSKCQFFNSNIDKVDFRYCEFAEANGRKNVIRDELDADKKVEESLNKPDMRFFASLRMTREEKKLRGENYEPVRRLYQELKCNFENKKDWNTAGDFHYGEMECRRKKYGWLGRKLFSLEALYYWASGYGERPLRAFIVLCLLAFLVFPLFSSVNDFWPYISRKQPFRFWNCAGEFFDSLKNSLRVATFTTVTKIGKEIYPDNGWDWVILVLESIFVYIQIFLFALALRRKVKR